MKVRILGCSGSVGSPENAASGYLVSAPRMPDVLMDIGPGIMAQLQQAGDPSQVHMLFSHLHPDHCMDFPSLLVWRRYHPFAPAQGRNLCYGPQAAPVHLGRLSADEPDAVDDFSDTFAFEAWNDGQSLLLDRITVTPFKVVHPIETYALRLEDPHSGMVIAYSGDSAYTPALIDAARNADVFLCEATWGKTSEGKAPNMHMSGAEAGRVAQEAGVKKLVLVHIPPWGDPEGALAAARANFDGEVVLGKPGLEL